MTHYKCRMYPPVARTFRQSFGMHLGSWAKQILQLKYFIVDVKFEARHLFYPRDSLARSAVIANELADERRR